MLASKHISVLTYFQRDHEGANGISLEKYILPLVDENIKDDRDLIKSLEWITQYTYYKPYLYGKSKRARFYEYSTTLKKYMMNKKAYSITTENNLLPLFIHTQDMKPTSGSLYNVYQDIIEAHHQNFSFSYHANDYEFIGQIAQFIISILLVADPNFKISAVDCRNLFLGVNQYNDMPAECRKTYANFEILYIGCKKTFDEFVAAYCSEFLDDWYHHMADHYYEFEKYQHYVRETRSVHNKSKTHKK